MRGGRLFLPVSAIAQALGDTLSSDPTARTVTVRRQNGTVAVFNAQLNEVRENGAVVLTVSGTADLIFPPIVNELMLPAEIVAALFDVVVRRDESTIVISRKGIQVETVRAGAKRAPWEIFQIEYDYNFSRYAGSGDHTLVLRGTGRIGDAKLSFITNSSIGITRNSTRPNLHGGTIRLDRTNGQSRLPGNLVPAQTWNSSLLLSAVAWSNCRWTECDSISLAATQLRNHGAADARSQFPPAISACPIRHEDLRRNCDDCRTDPTVRLHVIRGRDAFGGPTRNGNVVAGGLKYTSGVHRFQADLAAGQFRGVNGDKTQTTGSGVAFNLTGSYHLTSHTLQQHAYVGPKFLSPQSGIHAPNNLAAASVSWQPKRWSQQP